MLKWFKVEDAYLNNREEWMITGFEASGGIPYNGEGNILDTMISHGLLGKKNNCEVNFLSKREVEITDFESQKPLYRCFI